MAKSTLDVAEFGKVFVYNEHGDAVRLSELWQDTTAALILIRHFG